MFSENAVDVDSNKNLDVLNIGQFLAQLEIAGRTEIAHHSLKGIEVMHILGYALELLKQRRINIIKKLRTHGSSVSSK